MKLFKNKNNQIFAYEQDGSQDHLISEDLISITQSEANLIIAESQAKEFLKLPYQIKRASEYPSIGDQLDALFKAGLFPPEMAAKIQEVKDKYPKPE